MSASDLYREGRLSEAVEAAIERVRDEPTNASARFFLIELLLFNGDIERADRQLDTLGSLVPDAAITVSLTRQLIRASEAREQCFAEGRVPEVLEKPGEEMALRVRALAALRDGEGKEASSLLAQAETLRPHRPGSFNGEDFDELRDLDDLTSSIFEVFTPSGKYFWIDLDRVRRIEFSPLERPLDLLWRPAEISVVDGPEGPVHLPCLYPASAKAEDPAHWLGRATDWRSEGDGPTRGVGLKTFLVGEEARTLLEAERVLFKDS